MPAADSWYHEKESAWLYGSGGCRRNAGRLMRIVGGGAGLAAWSIGKPPGATVS